MQIKTINIVNYYSLTVQSPNGGSHSAALKVDGIDCGTFYELDHTDMVPVFKGTPTNIDCAKAVCPVGLTAGHSAELTFFETDSPI